MNGRKNDIVKNSMINLGVLLILVGSTATRVDPAFFFLALLILAIQTFPFSAVEPKKLVIAEIMISATIVIGAVTQLVTIQGPKLQLSFLIVLLLGGLLIIIEAVRKYAEL